MKNSSKIIISIFLFMFFFILISNELGYYENKNQKVKRLTEEQVAKFEKDIQEGKNVDITEYVVDDVADYSNNVAKGLYKVSLELEKLVDKAVKVVFTTSEKMVTN